MTPLDAYVAAYLAAAAVSAFGAALALLHREAVAARPLAAMLAAGAWWALLGAVDVTSLDVAGKILASQIQYLGVVSAPPLFLQTSLALLRGGRPAPRPLLALLWAVPLAVFGLAITNGAHGLVWREVRLLPGGLGEYHYGPAFWFFTAVSYLQIATGTYLVGLAAWRGRVRRRALGVLLVAALAGWCSNALYVFKVAPWPGFDWTVVGWTLTSLGLTWAVLGYGLLDLLPRARDAWLEATSDGVLVLDAEGRLRYANPAARALLAVGGAGEADLVAWLAAEAGEGAPRAGKHPEAPHPVEGAGPPGSRWLDLRLDPLPDGWGRTVGRVLTVRDVTARRTAELERERTLTDLRRALREVQTLQALLPICAGCKKIRDDAGRWSPVEQYLSQRSVATFSHGICPDCLERLYPDEPGGEGPAQAS